MAKKGLILGALIAALAFGLTGPAFSQAQTWYNSYAPGIDTNKLFINAGIGFGFSTYDMGIPPISASVDFKLPVKVPITVGATAAFSTWKYEIPGFASMPPLIPAIPGADVVYTNIGFGARAAYHFNFVKNLDVYSGITLGYVVQSSNVDGQDGTSFFLYGFNVGARYFFTKALGAYLEAGYSGLQIISVGLSLKF